MRTLQDHIVPEAAEKIYLIHDVFELHLEHRVPCSVTIVHYDAVVKIIYSPEAYLPMVSRTDSVRS